MAERGGVFWGNSSRPDSASPGPVRTFWILAACLFVSVSVLVIWLNLDIGGDGITNYVDNLGQLVAPLIAAYACARTARRTPGSRLAWGCLAGSCLSWGMGQGVWCYYDLLRQIPVPFPSLADAGYLTAVPLAVVGLLSFPSALRRAASRLGALLDGTLISGSLLFVSWATVLGPIYRAHQGGVLKQVLSMAYPASDVVLVSIVVVLATHTGRRHRAGLSLVLVGIVAFAVSDTSFAYLTEVNNYGIGSGLDVGWIAGYVLIALGAMWTVASADGADGSDGADRDSSMEESERVTMTSVLTPYALTALAGVVATFRLIEGRSFGVFLALEGFLLLSILGIRQVITLVDNATLNRRLLAKVELGTRELRDREARYSALVEHSSDPITIVKEDATVFYQSPSITRLLGWQSQDTLGKSLLTLLHPEDHECWQTVVRRLVGDPLDEVVCEWRFLHTDGSWRTFQSVATNLLDELSVAGLVLNSRDVTDQRMLEDRLRHEAFHDPLTGLSNRSLFAEHLDQAVKRAARTGASLEVMFIDVDDFKAVNDLRGRPAGDELLKQVAQRILSAFRDADTIARMGGDEFAVLFERLSERSDPHAAAARLLESFSVPFELGSESVLVSVSVGVATNSTGGESDEELTRHADLAVHAAKAQGKRTYVIYTSTLHGSILDAMRLEDELRRALDRDELVLYYQPIIDLRSGRTVAVEALVRWTHPERGLVAPMEFIPIAETSGLIVRLGEWALSQACCELQMWDLPAGYELRMAVNVSPRQLSDHRFASVVRDILDNAGLDEHRLTHEVTESMFVDDMAKRMELLSELRSIGVQIAIDDFGTGYSSLRSLRDMPVDVLKIDKSFVDHVASSEDSSRLVRMILQLAQDFGMRAVAEGVENLDQLETLREMGCHLIQGFYFSKPLPAAQLQTFLRRESADSIPVGAPGVSAPVVAKSSY